MTQADALLLSLVTEAPAAALGAASLGRIAAARAAATAMLATCATHPVLWEAFWELYPELGYWPAVAVGEAGVVVVEAVFYALLVPLPWLRALGVSLLANAVSVSAGLALAALPR